MTKYVYLKIDDKNRNFNLSSYEPVLIELGHKLSEINLEDGVYRTSDFKYFEVYKEEGNDGYWRKCKNPQKRIDEDL